MREINLSGNGLLVGGTSNRSLGGHGEEKDGYGSRGEGEGKGEREGEEREREGEEKGGFYEEDEINDGRVLGESDVNSFNSKEEESIDHESGGRLVDDEDFLYVNAMKDLQRKSSAYMYNDILNENRVKPSSSGDVEKGDVENFAIEYQSDENGINVVPDHHDVYAIESNSTLQDCTKAPTARVPSKADKERTGTDVNVARFSPKSTQQDHRKQQWNSPKSSNETIQRRLSRAMLTPSDKLLNGTNADCYLRKSAQEKYIKDISITASQKIEDQDSIDAFEESKVVDTDTQEEDVTYISNTVSSNPEDKDTIDIFVESESVDHDLVKAFSFDDFEEESSDDECFMNEEMREHIIIQDVNLANTSDESLKKFDESYTASTEKMFNINVPQRICNEDSKVSLSFGTDCSFLPDEDFVTADWDEEAS